MQAVSASCQENDGEQGEYEHAAICDQSETAPICPDHGKLPVRRNYGSGDQADCLNSEQSRKPPDQLWQFSAIRPLVRNGDQSDGRSDKENGGFGCDVEIQ